MCFWPCSAFSWPGNCLWDREFYRTQDQICEIHSLGKRPFRIILWSAYRPIYHRLAHFSLAGFTGLSAAGVLLDLPLMPLVLAPTAALASWDLVLEMHADASATDLYERAHLQYLSAALGLGLSGVGILVWIHLRLAFIAMLALGVILVVCLNWLVKNLQRNANTSR